MTVLILQRFRPEPALTLRRFGPDGRLAALAARGPAEALAVVVGPPGADGPPGAQGASGPAGQPTRFDFVSAATWIAAHGLGRVPAVLVHLASGEPVMADIVSTPSTVTVTHAAPLAGFILLI